MIKLSVVTYNNQAPLTALSALFGADGGTLGRSTDNHFVLPDPKYLLSRIQAFISSDGTRHVIKNLSQASIILQNGKEIEFGREYPLNIGDEIQIGLYVLRAESYLSVVDSGEANPAPLPDLPALLATPTEPPAAKSKAFPEISLHAVSNQPGAARPIPNLAELHQKNSEASAARAEQAENLSANQGGGKNPAKDVQQTNPPSADREALMQAFLKGAGIPHVNLNSDLTPEFMEALGNLLSTSVRGTFQLLATRASIKREVRADMTIVVVRNNNPLKFLSDSETVLIQMLRKKMPGFMGPTEAMQDAFADLQMHQNGMIAGMNGAISEVLKRFDPETIEKKVKAPTFPDSLFPAHRKAQLWDKYERLYGEIKQEAQHDYQKLFGKAFLKAYEKEIERGLRERQDG